jgi:hypothetical protein
MRKILIILLAVVFLQNQAFGQINFLSLVNETQIFLPNLNRDVNNTQEVTKDLITGALDGSVTVDNRLFTEEGRKNIVKDFENFGGNLAKALTGATGTVYSSLKTIYDAATGDNVGIGDIAAQWKANQTTMVAEINMDKEVINNLSEEKSAEEIEGAVNGKAKIYYDKKDENYGKHDNDTNEIYLNAAEGTATNTEQFINTFGHENGHNQTANEEIANNTGNFANTLWSLSNIFNLTSVNTSGGATSESWYNSNQNSAVLQNNNLAAGHIGNSSNKIIIEGSDQFKNKTMELLKELSGDKLDMKEDGTVVITNENNKNNEKTTGTELIRELAKDYEVTKNEIDKNDVKIIYKKENDKLENTSEYASNFYDGMIEGKGTGSIVRYDPYYNYSDLIRYTIKDGGDSPTQVILGHELIHSYSDKLGITAPEGVERVPAYEEQTVGLGIFQNNKITENTLRKEQKAKERLKYN